MRAELYTTAVCGFQVEVEKNLPRLRKACQYSLKVERAAVATLAFSILFFLCLKGAKISSFQAATLLVGKISAVAGLASCAALLGFSHLESTFRIEKQQWELAKRGDMQGTGRRGTIEALLQAGQD